MIEIKLYEYQLQALLIILNSGIRELKEEKEKPENRCDLSFYEIQISIYERIRCILQDSLIKE